MQKNLTKDILKVYWPFEDKTRESKGLTLRACWYNYVPRQFEILTDELKDMFEVLVVYPSPEEEDFDYEGKGNWIQVGLRLLIKKWPETTKWKETIELLHKNIMKYNPVVVYAYSDEFYDDPPDLFVVPGCFWAAMTDNGKFYFHSELMEDYSPLTKEELKELNAHVKKRMKEIENKE